MLTWLAQYKRLIVRNHSARQYWLNELLQLFEESLYGWLTN